MNLEDNFLENLKIKKKFLEIKDKVIKKELK